MPGMRARYGSGGMFMIDMHGTCDSATASSSSRTPGERYCGSCIASPTRSNAFGSTRRCPPRDSLPGSVLRVDLDQALAPLHRHAHDRALRVDELGFLRQAHERHVVAGERELHAEQRAVGGAQDENLASHGAKHRRPPRARRRPSV